LSRALPLFITAAVNSLLDVDEEIAVEINAGDGLTRHGQGKSIALVGHFPFIPDLRQSARNLWVIEQRWHSASQMRL
jgi:hypothetical protein